MKVGFVGEAVAGGDTAQGVIPFELFDEQLDPGTVVVKAPEVQRPSRQIGDEDLVVIPAELEEHQLGGRFFGLRSSDHDETIPMGPPSRLVAKLGHLAPAAGTAVPQVRELALDRGSSGGRRARSSRDRKSAETALAGEPSCAAGSDRGGGAAEGAPEGGRIRISVQPCEVLEDAVLPQ